MKFTQEMFLERATAKFGNKYKYELPENLNYQSKIIVICPEHGAVRQSVAHHLTEKSSGCGKCGRRNRSNKLRWTAEKFVEQSNKVHGNAYDYSITHYTNIRNRIKILCPRHGEFEMIAHNHVQGYGCVMCNRETRCRELEKAFLVKSKETHEDRYSYDLVDYKSNRDKVIIVCSKHGEFKMTPSNHLKGAGCAKCTRRVSHMAKTWLDSLGIKEREYTIPGTGYVVDGYDPENKVCYEFLGSFWHGDLQYFHPDDINIVNKKTFGELYKETVDRIKHIESLGYKVVTKWEVPKHRKKLDNKCLTKSL